MNTLGIVQARMGSLRLPGKVMMPLNNRPALAYVVGRAAQSRRLDSIVIATSVNPENDPIAQWAESSGYTVYRGSEEDVLSRFSEVARKYEPSAIARINADNFAIDPDVIDHTIDTLFDGSWDVVTPFIENTYPFGVGAEVASFDCLMKLDRYTEPGPASYREHIFLGAYENPETFNWTNLAAPPQLTAPDINVSVDTAQDFAQAERLFAHFAGREMEFRTGDIISLLTTRYT